MRILIVGSFEGHIGEAAKLALEQGAKVASATTTDEALVSLRAGKGADLVMVDVRQPLKAFLGQLESERIATPVVACGIGADGDAAVEAIRAGAREYVPLPPNAELIAAVIQAVSGERGEVICQDPAMRAVLDMADRIAPADASVLITGNSGTGKEVVSQRIHESSPRAKKSLVAVNCAAIPDNLLESELFGHEKGAFTGAVTRRIGKFEEAHGGTLLLDEISEMDPRLQAKLLRALQEREIQRVGGSQPVKVDLRVLATSNRDLTAEVAAGRFRQDLYYRLNVVTIHLPDLRDRPADIPALARYFVARHCEANGTPLKALSEAAQQALAAYDWPGNVRELDNAIQRAVLLSPGATIETQAIMLTPGQTPLPPAPEDPATENPAAIGTEKDGTDGAGADGAGMDGAGTAAASLVGQTVADVERSLILNTLDHTLGNRTQAANILGISIRTLRNKLKAYSEQGAPVPAPGEGETARAG